MVSNYIFFENEDELKQITGLTYEELWENGFNLDDMDWGFCTNSEINYYQHDGKEHEYEEDGYYYLDEIPEYLYFLLDNMDKWCVGFHANKFNNKWFYTLHHA